MHWAPIWYPYIDKEKSTITKKVLKPDTPQEIKMLLRNIKKN
ncbi:hypothetical protein [Holdemanella biformis]